MTVGQGSEIGNTGNFSDDWYWSSSEDEIPEAAYCFHFIYEAVGGNHREGLIKVRPIRAFQIKNTLVQSSAEGNLIDQES